MSSPSDANNAAAGACPPTTETVLGPGAPNQLVFTTQPGNGTAGSPVSRQPVVTVEDAYGNTVATDNDQITVTLSANEYSDGSTSATVGAVDGIATFSGLQVDALGSYTLTASDGSLLCPPATCDTSMPFTIEHGTGTTPTIIGLVVPKTPVAHGDPVTLFATVYNPGGTGAIPSGTVDFTPAGSTELLPCRGYDPSALTPVTGTNYSTASCTYYPPGSDGVGGVQKVAVSHSGDTTYAVSSNRLKYSVLGNGGVTVTMSAGSATVTVGTPAKLVATLGPQGSSTTPTGTVAFTASGPGPGPSCPKAPVKATGQAGCSSWRPSVLGVYQISGSYSGDADFATAASTTPVTITVVS